MASARITRINHLIQREVAERMYRIMTEAGFDLAAVTVTGVATSSDLRHARVRVSLRAPPAQQQSMLRRLERHHAEFQSAIARHIKIKYTPQVSFELDESIARGDHVLEIIHRMEAEHPEWDADAPPEAPPAAPAADAGDADQEAPP